MSKALKKNSHFISLLLHTHKDQARAILYTLSKPQVLVIAEVLFNLTLLPLPETKKNIVHKRKTIINKISDKKSSWGHKRNIIEKHYKSVWELLIMLKTIINKVIT